MALDDVISINTLADSELFAVDGSGNTSIAGTCTVTGALTASSTLGVTSALTASGGVVIPDSQSITFGTSGDSTLTHDGTTGLDWTFAANDTGALVLKDSAGTYATLDTTTAAVSLDLTCRVTTTDGVASGTERRVGGIAYRAVAASSAVTNSTTETTFDNASYTVPANTLKIGTVVRINFHGIATSTNGTDTLTIKLYIGGTGGTALATLGPTDVSDNDIFGGTVELICRTAGSGGTFVATKDYTALDVTGTALLRGFVASAAIDTTASQDIILTATWGAAATGNSCRCDQFTVDVIG